MEEQVYLATQKTPHDPVFRGREHLVWRCTLCGRKQHTPMNSGEPKSCPCYFSKVAGHFSFDLVGVRFGPCESVN